MSINLGVKNSNLSMHKSQLNSNIDINQPLSKRETELANGVFLFGLITGTAFGSVSGFATGYTTKVAISYVECKVNQVKEAVSEVTNLFGTIVPKIQENVTKLPEATAGFLSEAASKGAELAESASTLLDEAIVAAQPTIDAIAASVSTFANESIPAVKPMISQIANSIGLENQPWVIGLLPASIIVGGIGSRAAAGTTALIAKGSSRAFNALGMKHLAEDFDNLGTTMGNFATRSPTAELKLSLKATVISAAAYMGYNSM